MPAFLVLGPEPAAGDKSGERWILDACPENRPVSSIRRTRRAPRLC
jgi:hypothetical protein